MAAVFVNDIIIVWRRAHDGMELCLSRKEYIYFRHGPKAKFLPNAHQMDVLDAVIYASEHGYRRLISAPDGS